MYLEHIFLSGAIACIVGIVYYSIAGRDHSWITTCSAFMPDIDLIVSPVLQALGISFILFGQDVHHGDFHNLAFLLLYVSIVAIVLLPLRVKLFDALFFASVGYASHLFGDYLVYGPRDPLLWPISSQKLGLGLVAYEKSFFGIADSFVLVVTVVCFCIVFGVKWGLSRKSLAVTLVRRDVIEGAVVGLSKVWYRFGWEKGGYNDSRK